MSAPSTRIKVNVAVHSGPSVPAPIVACFPGGPPQELSAPSGDGVSFALVDDAPAGAKKKRMVLKATWNGGECSGRVSSDAPARYMVGVFTRATGNLDLYDAGTAVQLKHNVDDGGLAAALAAGGGTSSLLSYAERKRSLVETFGSKRKQRAQTAMEANLIGSDTIAGGHIISRQLATDGMKLLEETQGMDAAAAAADADMAARLTLVPFLNPHGVSVDNVFPLEQLAPPEVFKALAADSKALAAAVGDSAAIAALKEQGCWPEYVLDRLSKGLCYHSISTDDGAGSEKKQRKKIEKRTASLMAYLSYLVALHLGSKFLRREKDEDVGPVVEGFGFEGLAQFRETPTPLATHLVANFVESREGSATTMAGLMLPSPTAGESKYVRSTTLCDKLILHICILTLWIEGFKTDVATLALDLKLAPSKLLTYYKDLGCHISVTPAPAEVKGAPKSYTATLKLPLEFPSKKKGPASKR